MLFQLTAQMLILALMISGIPLLITSLSGLVISVLQAATSIQDQTIAYVVKLTTLIAVLFFCSRWFLSEILEFIRESLTTIAFV